MPPTLYNALHGSIAISTDRGQSWAAKQSAKLLEKEAEKKAADDLDLWLARLEREVVQATDKLQRILEKYD